MYANSAYNAYTENYIGIESPIKLIEMLYEGVLRFNAQAKRAMKNGDIEKRVYWTNRSIAVIAELKGSLDLSHGNIAQYLDGLYDYQMKLLTDVGIENDVTKLDECTNVFKQLLEAWRETTDVD